MKKFPVVPLLLCLTSQLININAGLLGRNDRHPNQTEWNNQATQRSHGALVHPHSPPISNTQSQTSRQHNSPINQNQQISQKTSLVNNNYGSQFHQSLNADPFHYQTQQNRGSQEILQGRTPQTVSSSGKTGKESKTNLQVRTNTEQRLNQNLTQQQSHNFGSAGPQLSSISNLDTRKAKKVPLVLITIHKPRGGNAQKSRTKVDVKAQNQKSVEDANSPSLSSFQRRPDQETYGQSHSSTGQNSNRPTQSPRFESNVQSTSRNNENIKTETPSDKNLQVKTDNFGTNQWHPVDKFGGKISNKITSNTQDNIQTNGRQAKNENVSQKKDTTPKLSQEEIQTNPVQAPEETSFVRKPIMNFDSRPFYVENGNSLNNHNHQVQPAVYVVSNYKNQQNLAQNYPNIFSFPNSGSIENPQNGPSEDIVRQQPVGVHTHVSTAEVVHFPSSQSQNTDTTHLSLRNTSPQTYYNVDSSRSNSDSHEKKILIPAIVEQKSGDKYSGQSLFQTGGHSRENDNLEHNFPQQIIADDKTHNNITESVLSQGTGSNYLNLNSLNNIFSSNQMQQMLALAIEQTRNPYHDNLNYSHNSQQNYNSELDSRNFFQTDTKNANSHMSSSVIMQRPFNAPQNNQETIANANFNQQFPQEYVIFPSSDKPENHKFNDGGSFVVNQKTVPEPTFKNKQANDNSQAMSNDRKNSFSLSIPNTPNPNFNQHSSMEPNSQNNYNSKNENPNIQIQISPLENQGSGILNVNIDPRLRNEQLSQTHYNVPNTYFPNNSPNEFSQTQVNEQITISGDKKEINFNLDARKIVNTDEDRSKTTPSISNQYRGFPNFPTNNQAQKHNSNPFSLDQNTREIPRPNEQAQTPDKYNPSVAPPSNGQLTHINEGNQKSSVPEALLLVLVSAQRSLESESDIRDHQSQEEYPDQVGQESIPQVAILRSILEAAGRQYNNGMVQKDTAVDTRRRSVAPLSG